MSYNKLVRDKIPDIIKSNGDEPIIKILDEDEYKKELEKKLLEECNEVINAYSKEDRLEELADVYEVLKSLSMLENSSIDEVAVIANKKVLKRGSFSKKIYLIDVK